LSQLEGSALARHLPKSPKDGDTSDDLARLPARLDAARKDGLTFVPSVLHPGVTTISGALMDPVGNSPMAIGLAYPTNAADGALQKKMEDAVIRELEKAKEAVDRSLE
jgi:DNA-binding IclR family transcriptional regulator